ncbi:ABC transporter ATP-binding protein/permease, partial [Anaerospora hongkongensis]
IYAVLATVFIVVKGYQLYARMLLHNRWRRWLTERYLTKWLQKKTYYRLQLMMGNEADNPDQRISEDVELFVMLTLRLSVDFLQDAVTIFSFVLILWNLSGVITITAANYTFVIYGYLVWLAFGYAIIGTYWTLQTGRPLVRLEYVQQRYEADFRFSLVRIRENAESIALYNGENKERQSCLRHFNYIVTNFMQIIAVRKRLMWLTTAYSQVAVIFSILVSSPRYFLGEIHLGQMFQVVDAYHHVQSGFSFIIDSFTRLAQWRAVVNRLNNFLTYMETVQSKNLQQRDMVYKANRNCFCAERVQVFQPDGHKLVSDLFLTIRRGDRIVITGPSGCGKSTVLRTFAGIWPFAGGELQLPAEAKIMFVPQKSYMPIDTLREVLLYPGLVQPVSDRELQEVLIACRLTYLTDKLNDVQDWGQVLSLGEQQRIAFARMILQKPDWLFLDEATSALDEEAEQTVYELVCRVLGQTAIISVGHRKTLLKYHTQRLSLQEKGGWTLNKC